MPNSETAPLLPRNGAAAERKAPFTSFLRTFWPLAFISFGGPQAHVALFHQKFVESDPGEPHVPESTFLELYALAQSLPGPGSTQLATALGATFGGSPGAFLTFMIWHLPGFIAMASAGVWFHSHLNDTGSVALIQSLTDHAVGLIAAAFAFVLLAAYKIVGKICGTNRLKMAIGLISMFVAVTIPPAASSWVFIVLLVGGGMLYYGVTKLNQSHGVEGEGNGSDTEMWESNVSPVVGITLLLVVLGITVSVAILPSSDLGFKILQIFWRIGLLVFGGGIVVVPMLLNEFVESGLLPTSVFLAGFGLFGCIPGPMFNLAPFLGAAVLSWPGAFYGSIGLFGPGVLLMVGLLPFWERLRRVEAAQTVLQGTNSAAAGLIMAGLWMLLKKAMVGPTAFALTCTAGAMAITFKTGPAFNILLHGVAGFILVVLGIGGPYHLHESSA